MYNKAQVSGVGHRLSALQALYCDILTGFLGMGQEGYLNHFLCSKLYDPMLDALAGRGHYHAL
jgi:hypothetical protein